MFVVLRRDAQSCFDVELHPTDGVCLEISCLFGYAEVSADDCCKEHYNAVVACFCVVVHGCEVMFA